MHVILSPYYTIEAYILYIVQLLQRAAHDRARSALCGILLLNLLYAPNLSIDQPYLDPMGVRGGVGQNVLDDSSGQFSCSLVLLEDD